MTVENIMIVKQLQHLNTQRLSNFQIPALVIDTAA
jgi:hypothetical protein